MASRSAALAASQRKESALHAVLCAAGYNIRWLLRAIARGGLKAVFLRLRGLWATLVAAPIGRWAGLDDLETAVGRWLAMISWRGAAAPVSALGGK